MNLSGWEPERMTQMCIFAGCDYLKSLPNMGPKRAHAAIFNSSANKAPLDECFVKAIAKLKMEGVAGEYLVLRVETCQSTLRRESQSDAGKSMVRVLVGITWPVESQFDIMLNGMPSTGIVTLW
jgi:hypothetical protein